jgi:hypothetical protein
VQQQHLELHDQAVLLVPLALRQVSSPLRRIHAALRFEQPLLTDHEGGSGTRFCRGRERRGCGRFRAQVLPRFRA